MQYQIQYVGSVEKELRGLPKDIRVSIVQKILSLADNPFPHGAVKLHGLARLYRFRQGDYRVIYEVQAEIVIIIILKIGHRRDVYKKM
jgi:mRNA interferase RelE/StbE